MRRIVVAGCLAAAMVTVFAGPTSAAEGSNGPGAGYDSIPRPLPGNLPSYGFEATQTSEFGNQIDFANLHPNKVGHVVVTMSSWGCQTGHWYTFNCSTQPGSTFSEPVTLNIYNPPAPGTYVPGSLIATQAKTFSIPYRPSANNTHCTGADMGKWYDASSQKCFNGLATNITFDFHPRLNVPDSVVFGIAYDTSTSGYSPYGVGTACFVSSGGCGYDSLNVALSTDPTDLHAGSDPNPGTVFQYNAGYGYCDGGAHGVDVFRLDSPDDGCWSYGAPGTLPAYIPSVRFAG